MPGAFQGNGVVFEQVYVSGQCLGPQLPQIHDADHGCEKLQCALAFLNTIVVRGFVEFATLIGIGHDDGVSVQIQRNLTMLDRVAIEHHGMPGLREGDCKLIHDATLHTHEVVLGRLRYANQIQ